MNPSRGAMKCAARRIRALRIVRRHPSFPLQRPVSLAPRRHRAIALGHNGGDGAAKTLFLARVHPLVPGSSVDDVQTAVEPPLPMPVEVARNVTVPALSPDGQALRQTTTRTLDGERAATLVKALVEAARA